MTNRQLVDQALKHLEATTITGKQWVAKGRPATGEWGKAKALLDQVDKAPADPGELEPPTDLKITHIGEWSTQSAGHVESGRSIHVEGKGTPGVRVNISSSDGHALAGGDAVKPDGTFRVPTVLLRAGTWEIRAYQQTSDATRKSGLSEPVTVTIPPE